MKKTLLSLLVMVCAAATASADIYTYDFMSNGLAYKINNDGSNTVSVTYEQRCKHLGWDDELGADAYSPSYPNLAGAVSIPGTVQNNNKMYRVTRIEQEAFWGCTAITSVSIPASVTTVEPNPFQYCYNLEAITVAEGNTVYDSRDNCNAIVAKDDMNISYTQINSNGSGDSYTEFWYTMNRAYAKDAIVVGCKGTVIPSSVKAIGYKAFRSVINLKSLVIPEGVTSIDEDAFVLAGLESLTLPSTLTEINKNAFADCMKLLNVYAYFGPTDVTLGRNVWNFSIHNPEWDVPTNLHVYPQYANWYDLVPNATLWENADMGNCRFNVIGDLGVEPTPMYIIGSWDGWAQTIAMTLNDAGKWTITKAMDAGVQFKFKDEDGNWYGGEDTNGVGYFEINKDLVTSGTPITLVDGENFLIPVAGEWTFTLDPTNMTVVVSGEWNEPQEPKHVYILGEVNGNTWATNVGVEMATEDEVTFTADVICGDLGMDQTDGYGYFSFTKKLAETPGDWSGIEYYRFGAESADFAVSEEMLGTELGLQAGTNAFKLADGEYTFIVNLETMKLVITKNGAAGKPGDANEDESVDVNDVTTIINYILGKNPNPFNFDNANVNGDDKVDVMDVTLIINMILGINE